MENSVLRQNIFQGLGKMGDTSVEPVANDKQSNLVELDCSSFANWRVMEIAPHTYRSHIRVGICESEDCIVVS
jgi:hypothetical protein